jgi:galactose mutarotase-like enzyme
MGQHELKNEILSITVNDFGAELTSIVSTKTGQSYLWNADQTYWKRHSPVLFPIVGSLKGKSFRYNGNEYPMSQHGFARDMEFKCIEVTETSIKHRLTSTPDTMKQYPFSFYLDITYKLKGNTIEVNWDVTNTDTKEMYFSIGAHPAFYCPLISDEKQSDYYLQFDTTNPLQFRKINEDGLVKEGSYTLPIDGSLLPLNQHLFDEDALIIENNQAHSVALLTPDKKPYVTVNFDAPLFGLWSPAKKNAPFVCIEPWYGRCDSETYADTLENRAWGNHCKPAETFHASYTITIN